ncbi:MAG: sugar ABC transporter substrate-binding protein [Clostridiales bacterium]|nr:sugar ABC transporter substrate-binding protein [Clostridiales bacterium]
MKKALTILLAVLMIVSLFACASQSSGTSTPASGAPASSAPASSAPASGEPASDDSKYPKEAGFFDPDFDYTKYDKYKVAFLSMTAGELWDAFDVAYENWANKVNIDYTNLWAPTQYSADEFLSGMQTFVDQGFDGLILEAGTQNYERVAEILGEAGVEWVSGLGVARASSGSYQLLHPQVGFDNFTIGMQTLDLLVKWKDETFPDVPYDKVGMLLLDYSYSPDIHNRGIGMEQQWAKLHPEFGAFDPAPDKNPKNFFIGDIASAQYPDQTAAQNLATQFLSNPGDIEVWLIGTPADLYSVGAANAADNLGMTDKVCTACQGGVALPTRWDSGIDDAWRFAIFSSQQIYAEPIVCQLWAYMSGQATPETIFQDWVNVNDKGDVKDENGKVIEEHSYAIMMLPYQPLTKDNYKDYLEWTDLYAFGPGAEGVWKYPPVTDINLFPTRATPPASYKVANG